MNLFMFLTCSEFSTQEDPEVEVWDTPLVLAGATVGMMTFNVVLGTTASTGVNAIHWLSGVVGINPSLLLL